MTNDNTEKSSAQLNEINESGKLKKAADVHINGSDDVLENVEADTVLESTAAEAKKAEKFDHGKADAGKKK